ncbi:hypothetical protein BJX99DRAFT_254788 [Aspergillus californicus]
MSRHQGYKSLPSDTADHIPSLVTEPIALPPLTIPRPELVNELIKRVECFRIVRVDAPSVSGKTTMMNLLINTLLEWRKTMPIHTLTGWNRTDVESAGGWKWHLAQKTGQHGDNWLQHPAYLLIDDAQETYWDEELWSGFFNNVNFASSSCIVLFTSFCLPDSGSSGLFERKSTAVPMALSPAQQISFCAGYHVITSPWTPIGLQLSQSEAEALVLTHASPFTFLSEGLKISIFQDSNGHIGALITMVHTILQGAVHCPESPYDSDSLPPTFSS